MMSGNRDLGLASYLQLCIILQLAYFKFVVVNVGTWLNSTYLVMISKQIQVRMLVIVRLRLRT